MSDDTNFLDTIEVENEVVLKSGYVHHSLKLVKIAKVQKQKVFITRYNGLGQPYLVPFRRKDGSSFNKDPYSLLEATPERLERIKKDELLQDVNRAFKQGLDKLSLPQLSEIASILNSVVNKA